MINTLRKSQTSFSSRVVSLFIAVSLIATVIMPPSMVNAQMLFGPVLNLPMPGTMVPCTDSFAPVLLQGITVDPSNPLKFDFLIDTGETNARGTMLKEESLKQIKYFLASLTVPEEEMWVNLSPYEQDRIIPQHFGDTELGRDLLAQDYMLKQLSASIMYPEDEPGAEFWERVYERAKNEFGTTEIPLNTFNKIWIIPEKAVVYEHESTAFVVERHLKVLLEEDYVALQQSQGIENFGLDSAVQDDQVISGVTSGVVREILIPEIEKEVNHGKIFANLRQIYNSVILASWFKDNLKETLLGQVYVDQSKTKGIDPQDKEINQKIYHQYVASYKKGVYNYIKEEYDPASSQLIPRKYFSGGNNLSTTRKIKQEVPRITAAQAENISTDFALTVNLLELSPQTQNVNAVAEDIDERNADPFAEDFAIATFFRDYQYPAGNFQIRSRNLNNNYVKTKRSRVSLSVGMSMLNRGLMPEKEEYPSVIVAPGEDWVGADGSHLMQIYFAAVVNYSFHKRKTTIVVKNEKQKQRVLRYLELGNPYYLPNEAGYDQETINRFRKEAIVLAHRALIGEAGKLKMITPQDDMVDIVVLSDEGSVSVEGVTITDKKDGTYEVQDGDEKVTLQGKDLSEVDLVFEGVEPLTEIPHSGITFLGTSSGMDKDGLSSNQIVWANQKGILVDANPATIAAIKSLGIEASDMEYVALTHMHEDHVAGALAYFHWLKENNQPIRLIMEPGIYALFKEQASLILNQDFESVYPIEFISLKFNESREIGEGADAITLEAIPAFHGTPTMALRIDYNGETVSLSSDTTLAPQRLEAFSQSGLPGIPEEIILDLFERTDYKRGEMLMSEERVAEIRDALFKENNNGKKPTVVFEVGYGNRTKVEDTTNHTSPFDLDIYAKEAGVLIYTNHSPSLPEKIENLNQAKPFTTVDIINGFALTVGAEQKSLNEIMRENESKFGELFRFENLNSLFDDHQWGLLHQDQKYGLIFYERSGILYVKEGRYFESPESVGSFAVMSPFAKTLLKKASREVTQQEIEVLIDGFIEQGVPFESIADARIMKSIRNLLIENEPKFGDRFRLEDLNGMFDVNRFAIVYKDQKYGLFFQKRFGKLLVREGSYWDVPDAVGTFSVINPFAKVLLREKASDVSAEKVQSLIDEFIEKGVSRETVADSKNLNSVRSLVTEIAAKSNGNFEVQTLYGFLDNSRFALTPGGIKFGLIFEESAGRLSVRQGRFYRMSKWGMDMDFVDNSVKTIFDRPMVEVSEESIQSLVDNFVNRYLTSDFEDFAISVNTLKGNYLSVVQAQDAEIIAEENQTGNAALASSAIDLIATNPGAEQIPQAQVLLLSINMDDETRYEKMILITESDELAPAEQLSFLFDILKDLDDVVVVQVLYKMDEVLNANPALVTEDLLNRIEASVDTRGEDVRAVGLHLFEAMATANDFALSSTPRVQSKNLGGINLNPNLIDLQIRRDGEGIPLPVDQQGIKNMNIDGFLPVIINVQPINNLQWLLGLSEGGKPVAQKEKQEVSGFDWGKTRSI